MSVSEDQSASTRRVPSWLKEPLLHFLVAAALLTAAYHFFGKPEVKISAQLFNGLCKDYETATGHPASAEDKRKLLDEYLENEILYREAIRTGLMQDNRVRAMLVHTMRTSLRPIVPQPTEEDLVALRKQTPEIYRYPARAGFEHVSFPDMKSVPEGILEKLKAGAAPQGLGDETVRLANPLPVTFRTQLDYLFGAEFTDRLMTCETGVWVGPFASKRGVHFVKVLQREEERDMPMDELRPTLIGKWTGMRENEIIFQRVAELRKSYRVDLPALDSAQP